MSFEIFKQVGVSSKVYISVSTSKSFGFPRTFLDKYGITNDHKVVIMYDGNTNRVALHFTTENAKYGLKVQIPNERHGGSINAKSFFDLKNIDAAKYTGRYDDFEITPMSDLGISAPGSAFVITLREFKDENEEASQTEEGDSM